MADPHANHLWASSLEEQIAKANSRLKRIIENKPKIRREGQGGAIVIVLRK